MSDLFAKYDIQAPRYTSYPTVPYWETAPNEKLWIEHIKSALNVESASWSMYLHIPYCETLCTYCGCNTIITKDHSRESSYVDLILKEWELYKNNVPELTKKKLKHLHIGGGTPTFLSEENLVKMLKPILDSVQVVDDFEASIEVDPRRTNKQQLAALRQLGFNRISLGVQDFDAEVQRLVNRVQPYELTKEMTDVARELGYSSVNFDLIYGLAKQTPETIKASIEKTISLRPDRIALYSLALVPWIKPAQKLFKDEDLPAGKDKRELYEISRSMLLNAGYLEVGMDHFALPTDSLGKALKNQTLHRNFMGYTDQKTDVLLGLGVSSISETPDSFHQNEKVLAVYQQKIESDHIATHRGHILTDTDKFRRKQILEFMTRGEVKLENDQINQVKSFLSQMFDDQLVEVNEQKLLLKQAGRPFLRNACLFFDERLKLQKPNTQVFSKSL